MTPAAVRPDAHRVAPPDGYVAHETGGTWCVARADVADAFAQALREAGTLHAWAGAHPEARQFRGRGVVHAAPFRTADGGAVPGVVRHAWHGGFFAPLTRDRWRPPTRAPRELRIALRLRAAGVPTPTVLGYATYAAGARLRRADVVLEEIAGGADYGAVLTGEAPFDRAEAEDAVRALLVTMARVGAKHGDLNVKNLFLAPADGALRASLLDVDEVTFGAPFDATRHAANRARLFRSLRKWRDQGKLTVTEAWLDAFAQRVDETVAAAARDTA